MSNSTNLVKKRNIDPELLNLLGTLAVKGNISLTDMESGLQDLIRKAGSITATGNYDDTIMMNLIRGLTSTKADTSTLVNYFNKATDKISSSQLDASLLNLLGMTSGGTTTVFATKTDLNNYRDKTVAIEESDLSKDLLNKLDAMMTRIAAATAAANTVTPADISGLQTQIDTNSATEKTDKLALQQATSDGLAGVNTTLSQHSDSITLLEKKVADGMISEDRKVTESMLDPTIVTELSQIAPMQTEIDDVKNAKNSFTGTLGQVISVANSSGLGIGTDMVINDRFAKDDTEITAMKAISTENIYDVTNNLTLSYDSTTLVWTESAGFLSGFPYYKKLLYSESTGCMYLFDDTLHTILTPHPKPPVQHVPIVKQMDFSLLKDAVYTYDQSVDFTVGYERGIQVFVKNIDAASPYKDKYIIDNGKVSMVVFDANNIIVINTDTVAHDFKLIVKE